jgi:hypothetical protein
MELLPLNSLKIDYSMIDDLIYLTVRRKVFTDDFMSPNWRDTYYFKNGRVAYSMPEYMGDVRRYYYHIQD